MNAKPSLREPGVLLVGIADPAGAGELVRLSSILVGQSPWQTVLVHVVTVADQISLTTGQSSPEVVRASDALEEALARARSEGVEARGVVEVARSVDEGLLAAAETQEASMILVGYSREGAEGGEHHEREEKFDRAMHRVARKTDTDVVFARLRRKEMREILVPLTLEAPLRLTAFLCRALAEAERTSISFFHVTESASAEPQARTRLKERLTEAGLAALGTLEVVVAEDAVEAITARAVDQDLVVLGPSGRPHVLEGIISSRATRITEGISASVLLAWGEEDEEAGG